MTAERAVSDLSTTTGLRVRPDQRVSDLSVGEAQRVEILKTLYRGAKILILDEPTAVLSPPEVDELWRVLRGMRDRGDTIVLITHKLDEVIAISDTVTVMRQGQTVGRVATRDTSPAELAKLMVGRDVVLATDASALRTTGASLASAVALEVRDLSVRDAHRANTLTNVSFTVASGEILGIAGVEGNGQTELIEAISWAAAAVVGRNRARRSRYHAGVGRGPWRCGVVAHSGGPACTRARA